jgi:hypothetical protein
MYVAKKRHYIKNKKKDGEKLLNNKVPEPFAKIALIWRTI